MSASNRKLNAAKRVKNDEFYTQLCDIESEVSHYHEQLRGKVVYCNCDNPMTSNFVKYFITHFNTIGLKRLIATCYSPQSTVLAGFNRIDNRIKQAGLFANEVPPGKHSSQQTELNSNEREAPLGMTTTAYKAVINDVPSDLDVENKAALGMLFEYGTNELSKLEEGGDFRSVECIELLKESEVVITNPPFSLFREFVGQAEVVFLVV